MVKEDTQLVKIGVMPHFRRFLQFVCDHIQIVEKLHFLGLAVALFVKVVVAHLFVCFASRATSTVTTTHKKEAVESPPFDANQGFRQQRD